jgi:hypothetical protein
MSSPYGDLIGQLQHLQEMMDPPFQHISALSDTEDLASVQQARAGLVEALGNVPLPDSHPDFERVTGAIGNAQGMVDNITQAYQVVIQEATDAKAAIEHVRQAVADVIANFNAGSR